MSIRSHGERLFPLRLRNEAYSNARVKLRDKVYLTVRSLWRSVTCFDPTDRGFCDSHLRSLRAYLSFLLLACFERYLSRMGARCPFPTRVGCSFSQHGRCVSGSSVLLLQSRVSDARYCAQSFRASRLVSLLGSPCFRKCLLNRTLLRIHRKPWGLALLFVTVCR